MYFHLSWDLTWTQSFTEKAAVLHCNIADNSSTESLVFCLFIIFIFPN